MNSLPLARRIGGTAPPVVPAAGDLHWRPIVIGDLDSVTALAREADRVDHPHYLTSRDEVEQDLDNSWVELDVDSLIGFAAEHPYPVAFGLAILTPVRETLVRSLL